MRDLFWNIFVSAWILFVTITWLWFVGSMATSAVKEISDDCNKTYPIEKIFSGNWYCPYE